MCTVACVSPETLSFFLAATSIGVGYAVSMRLPTIQWLVVYASLTVMISVRLQHPDMYEPRETSVPGMIPLVSPHSEIKVSKIQTLPPNLRPQTSREASLSVS